MKIYTIGYLGRVYEDVLAIVQERQAILVDIRFSPGGDPRSIHLSYCLGERYAYVRELGNPNDTNGKPMALANPEAAVPAIRALLAKRPLILMCACRDLAQCHRKLAAEFLQRELGVDVEHL